MTVTAWLIRFAVGAVFATKVFLWQPVLGLWTGPAWLALSVTNALGLWALGHLYRTTAVAS